MMLGFSENFLSRRQCLLDNLSLLGDAPPLPLRNARTLSVFRGDCSLLETVTTVRLPPVDCPFELTKKGPTVSRAIHVTVA